MTSPQIWFHSEVALTYIVDGLLVALVVLICWRAMSKGGRWKDAILIGALLAVVGGVRQQEVIALSPVVLYTFWRFDRNRYRQTGDSPQAIALGLGLLWFCADGAAGGRTGGFIWRLSEDTPRSMRRRPGSAAAGPRWCRMFSMPDFFFPTV